MPNYNEDSFQDERLQYHLQVQANQIQNVLDVHGAPYGPINGVARRDSFFFNIQAPLSSGIERIKNLTDDFKKALGIEGIRFTNEKGQLQLEVIRPFEPAVPLLDLISRIRKLKPYAAILGFAENGMVAHHDFTQPDSPNILISGAQNAGKTVLLRSMAISLALTNRQADVQLVVINPITAGAESQSSHSVLLRPLNYIPHMLTDVVSRQTEISEILQFLVREMNYRNDHLFHLPKIIVFIDQAGTLLQRGGRSVKEAINRIAERGDSAGIHLVMATSRSRSPLFSPHLLTNLQARIIGWEDDPSSNDVFENQTKPDDLLGEGDFLIKGLNNYSRFQAAYIDDYDLHMTLSKLYEQRPVLLAQPISTRVQLNASSSKEETEMSFMLEDGIGKVA